ncbi:hypothetical protein [Bradyrhizobium sp.]|uniref:hypothetical protein n=1 Tax=Bradyrhizobium sp. TaxID=376 RepID=UPI00403784D6
MTDPPPYPGAPLWLRRFGIAVGVLALPLVVLVHGGCAGHHGTLFFGTPSGSASESPY